MRKIATRQRSLYASILVGAALIVSYLVVPHRSTQYAAWLVVFSVWMIWFVATAVEFIWEE